MKLSDFIGRRFGRLVVVDRIKGKNGTEGRWVCQCDCGGTKSTVTNVLARGNCKSCGCLAREITSARSKKPDTYFRMVFSIYRRNAARRGIDFALNTEEFRKLIIDPCKFCGRTPDSTYSLGVAYTDEFKHNGVDRYDNEQGYVTGNCVPCCKICNRMKHDMTAKEFLDHTTRIYEFSS